MTTIISPTDAALDAAYEAFKAHSRGVEFNEFNEHVCSECGYAFAWPTKGDGDVSNYTVPPRRMQRHVAHESLRAAGVLS